MVGCRRGALAPGVTRADGGAWRSWASAIIWWLTVVGVDEYRRFRHRIRHIYGYELEAERVLILGRGVQSLLERVKTSRSGL